MSSYPLWLRVLERAGLATSALCAVAIVAQIRDEVSSPLHIALASAACVLGYLLADFVTGFVHWAFDRLGTPATPVVGPALIAPFHLHHAQPEEMTQHGFVELCGASFILVAALWLLTWLLPSDPWGGHASATVRAFTLSLGFFTGITNQLHCWAHQRECGPLVTRLQRLRLILPPELHALHHAPPYEGHYGVTTGWCNGLLLRSGLFERLEGYLGVREPALRGAAPPDPFTGARSSPQP